LLQLLLFSLAFQFPCGQLLLAVWGTLSPSIRVAPDLDQLELP